MTNCFDITSQTKSFTLTAGDVASAELTITNTSGRPVTGIISISNREQGDATQLRFVSPQQQHFENNESNIIPISIHSSNNAVIGDSTIKFLIAAEHNPDEEFAVYDFPLTILEASEKPKPRWPWILAAACGFLLLVILGYLLFAGKGSAKVPMVIGLSYEEAAQRITDAGFVPNFAATNLADLQTDTFKALAPELIKRIHFINTQNGERTAITNTTAATTSPASAVDDKEKKNTDTQPDLSIPIPEPAPNTLTRTGTETGNETESAKNTTTQQKLSSKPQLLKKRLVWQQGLTGLVKKGSLIPLKVVPQLLTIKPPQKFGQDALKQYFENQHVFFKSTQKLPENYRYGAGIEGAPTFNPSLQAVFEGSQVTANILPDQLEVPDFTKMNLNDIAQLPRRVTKKLSSILDWANIQKDQGRFVYIYAQTPSAAAKVVRDNHIITLEIDSRLSGLAQKRKH